MLWLPPDSTYAIGNDLFGDWAHVLRPTYRGQLRVTHLGDPFSVFLFTHDDGSFRGWYVNLERGQRRSALGFDYEDDLLDVWVALGAEPELLDEDELGEAVRLGFVSAQAARDDYFYRAPHVVSLASKRIIAAYYGSPPARSYFDGCSTGGRRSRTSTPRHCSRQQLCDRPNQLWSE